MALSGILTGDRLLSRIKELGDRPRAELARECGYVSTRKDGQERLNFTAFYEALLDAKGMNIGRPASPGQGRRGRPLSYHAKVQFNGNLLIGPGYTVQLGFKPGDLFEIRLGKGQIKLVPSGGEGDE
jgi:hypothetical protein